MDLALNLKKFLFWNKEQENLTSNKDEKSEKNSSLTEKSQYIPSSYVTKFKGLMNEEEIINFFNVGYYMSGYNSAVHYGTSDGMNNGLSQMVYEFKNILEMISERKERTLSEIEIKKIQIRGLSKSVEEELIQKAEQHKRDLLVLNEQSRLASEYKGWIAEAVNKYQAGYKNGIREAIEMHFLGFIPKQKDNKTVGENHE
jgi:hypothetical protein